MPTSAKPGSDARSISPNSIKLLKSVFNIKAAAAEPGARPGAVARRARPEVLLSSPPLCLLHLFSYLPLATAALCLESQASIMRRS
jgi:hypothetical protein